MNPIFRNDRRPAHTLLCGALIGGAATVLLGWPLLAAPNAVTTKVNAPKTARTPGKSVTAPVKPAALTEDQKIMHAFNRLAYGPRPGDIERVRITGLDKWIDQQLHPESIPDRAIGSRLASLKNLKFSQSQLFLAYHADQIFRKEMKPQKIERRLERGNARGADAPGDEMQNAAMQNEGAAAQRLAALSKDITPQQQRLVEEARAQGMEQGISTQLVGELIAAKLLRAIESDRQLHEVMVDFWSNHFNLDVKKNAVRTFKIADERDVIRPHTWGKFRDLLGASAKSPAMLVYLDNARSTKPPTERVMQVRRGVGNRRQARRVNRTNNPALQNEGIMDGEAMTANGATAIPVANAPRRAGGINENYARELMELHTLGVNGGYTQKDVQEVARCLTGWSVGRDGEFQFKAQQHDNGEKIVLGHRIPANGGIQDGERVLDILASHPSTAKFLARKMAMRLVADEPPAALVERAAQAFTKSGGDLRVVTKTIVTSPEFWDPSVYRAKIKSPYEYAVSAVRVLGGTLLLPDTQTPLGRATMIYDGYISVNPNNGGGGRGNRAAKSLARAVSVMGQPLYSYQAPTGYTENSQSWVSAGALVSRLNFALDLTSGSVSNTVVAPKSLVAGLSGDNHEVVLESLLTQLIGYDVSAATRETLKKELPSNTPVDAVKLSGLILGSPEFQRR